MASAVNWSVAALPAYMAAKELKNATTNAIQLAAPIAKMASDAVFSRKDLQSGDIAETIRGLGRSYFKDVVKKGGYEGNYEDWAASPEGAQVLQLAEGGIGLRQTADGYQMQNQDGSWRSFGTWDTNSTTGEKIFDMFGNKKSVNAFESYLQNKFLTPDYQMGNYEYTPNRTALGALLNPKEKLRPEAGPYQDPLMAYFMQNNPWYANPSSQTNTQTSNQFAKPVQKGTTNTTQNNSGSVFQYNRPSWSTNQRGNKLTQNRNK
tara:strand:- start:8580 stop:9368 length:789 start_codon:yes stop_codon:yes gene_type:complete